MKNLKLLLVVMALGLVAVPTAFAACPCTSNSTTSGEEQTTDTSMSGALQQQPPQVQGNISDDTDQVLNYVPDSGCSTGDCANNSTKCNDKCNDTKCNDNCNDNSAANCTPDCPTNYLLDTMTNDGCNNCNNSFLLDSLTDNGCDNSCPPTENYSNNDCSSNDCSTANCPSADCTDNGSW